MILYIIAFSRPKVKKKEEFSLFTQYIIKKVNFYQ
jgi:hypothetical protein